MRKGIMVMAVVFVLMLAGCGKPLLDVAAGGLAENTLAGFNKGVDEEIAKEQAKRAELLDQLKNSNDEIEKDILREQVASKDKRIGDLVTAKEVGRVGKEAFGINWSDPTEVSTFGGSAIGLIMWYLQRKKTEKESRKYKAHKAGVNKTVNTFSISERPEAKQVLSDLYTAIGEERAKLGVS